jgi:hypothetical protein
MGCEQSDVRGRRHDIPDAQGKPHILVKRQLIGIPHELAKGIQCHGGGNFYHRGRRSFSIVRCQDMGEFWLESKNDFADMTGNVEAAGEHSEGRGALLDGS